MNLGEALNLSQQHLSQLIEFLDVNGYGQKSAAVRDAREFEERYLKYVRSRRCCMNCAFCRPDDRALPVGKLDDPPVCTYGKLETGSLVYITGDPAECGMDCGRFAIKYDVPWKEENT